MIDAIKKYLEEAVKTDSALAEVYKPEKLEDCCNYIFTSAKKLATGGNNMLCVEDAVVFKWARDFYFGHTEAVTEGDVQQMRATVLRTEKKPVEVKTEEKKPEKKSEPKKPAEDPAQCLLFDLE